MLTSGCFAVALFLAFPLHIASIKRSSPPSCISPSKVNCDFEKASMCGWTNSAKREFTLEWTFTRNGEVRVNTPHSYWRKIARKAHLTSPHVCLPACSKAHLSFRFKFSGYGGGILDVGVCGESFRCFNVFNATEKDSKWAIVAVDFSAEGPFQVTFTGENDPKEKIASDIYLDDVSLTANQTVTCTTTTETVEAITTSPLPTDPTDETVVAHNVSRDAFAQEDDDDNFKMDTMMIIIPSAVGGLVIVAIVITVLVVSRHRRNARLDKERWQAAARMRYNSRNSSVIVENELYLSMDLDHEQMAVLSNCQQAHSTQNLHPNNSTHKPMTSAQNAHTETDDVYYSSLRETDEEAAANSKVSNPKKLAMQKSETSDYYNVTNEGNYNVIDEDEYREACSGEVAGDSKKPGDEYEIVDTAPRSTRVFGDSKKKPVVGNQYEIAPIPQRSTRVVGASKKPEVGNQYEIAPIPQQSTRVVGDSKKKTEVGDQYEIAPIPQGSTWGVEDSTETTPNVYDLVDDNDVDGDGGNTTDSVYEEIRDSKM